MNITTDYEAFVYIREKLLEQNAKSLRHDETCVYRGHSQDIIEKCRPVGIDPDYDEQRYFQRYEDNLCKFDYNLKCAVGHLIKDNLYSPHIEEQQIAQEPVLDVVIKSNPDWQITEDSVKLLTMLQYIHDRRVVDFWETDFNTIKHLFNEAGSYIGDLDTDIFYG